MRAHLVITLKCLLFVHVLHSEPSRLDLLIGTSPSMSGSSLRSLS